MKGKFVTSLLLVLMLASFALISLQQGQVTQVYGQPDPTTLSVQPPSIVNYTLSPQPSVTIRPVLDGTFTDWTGDYTCWDEATQNGDTDYVKADANMMSESSQLEDPVHHPWDIARVRVVAYARTNITTDEQLVFVLVIGGVEYWADYPTWPMPGYTLTTSYEKYTWDWGKNPATGDYWTWSDIDSLEAGVESEVSQDYVWTGEIRVTQLYVEVQGPRFTVNVDVSNVDNLWGYGLILSYDTSVLTATGYKSYDPFTNSWPSEINDQITSVTGEEVGTGDNVMLKFSLLYRPVVGGSDTVYLNGVEQTRDVDYSINYTAGEITFTVAPENGVAITADYQYTAYVSVSYSKPTGQPGVSGNMSLVQIAFLVEALGRTKLVLHDTKLTNPDANPISHEAYGGYFRNTILGDIDGDGDVDPSDFYIFSGAYGTSIGHMGYNLYCDLDDDGDVDPSDFYIFSGAYGKTI